MTIESDLRKQIRANIVHHRAIGSYVGRRHAMGLPVRGQKTRSNAMTARRLNGRWLKAEKKEYSTASRYERVSNVLQVVSMSVLGLIVVLLLIGILSISI